MDPWVPRSTPVSQNTTPGLVFRADEDAEHTKDMGEIEASDQSQDSDYHTSSSDVRYKEDGYRHILVRSLANGRPCCP